MKTHGSGKFLMAIAAIAASMVSGFADARATPERYRPYRPSTTAGKSGGMPQAAARRLAKKKRNVRRHRAACRG